MRDFESILLPALQIPFGQESSTTREISGTEGAIRSPGRLRASISVTRQNQGDRRDFEMSFLLTDTMDGQILEVTVSDSFTRDTYDAFLLRADAAIEEFGRIRVLFLILGFRGWEAGLLWRDLPFIWNHFPNIDRLALVGEAKWETGMTEFTRPFSSATIGYFEQKSLEQAREWIQGDSDGFIIPKGPALHLSLHKSLGPGRDQFR